MIEIIKKLVEWGGIGALVLLFLFFWKKITNGK